MTRTLLSLAVAATLASTPVLAQTSGQAQTNNNPTPETVVADVNGAKILLGELVAIHESLPDQLRNAPFQALYPQLRERAIDSLLLGQAAEASDIDSSPEVMTRLAEARLRILQQVFLEQKIASEVTPEAIDAVYQANYVDGEKPVEVRARHILLETEEAAKDVITALDGGGDFEALARERSTGPSGQNGGDLGYFERERMVPEFAEAAFTQEVGTYTKSPVQTQFGYHVIFVEDRREQPAPPLAQVRGEIETQLSREAINGLINGLRSDKDIQLFAIDGTPEAAQ